MYSHDLRPVWNVETEPGMLNCVLIKAKKTLKQEENESCDTDFILAKLLDIQYLYLCIHKLDSESKSLHHVESDNLC